jgi:cytochrome c-type biogenesis protein CcmH/NrfG
MDMIKERPLLGVGTGRFQEAYPDFQRKFFRGFASASWVPKVAAGWKGNYNASVEAPHNEYLQIAAEMGLPGLTLFSAFLLYLLVGGIRRGGASSPSWRNGCVAGCFAILVASFFGFPLHVPATGALFFLLAGLLGPPGGASPGRQTEGSRGDPLFGTLLVLLAALVLLQLIQQGKVLGSGRYLYRAIGYQLSGKAERALADLSEAKRLNPQDPEIDYWLGMLRLSAGSLNSARSSLEKAKSSFNSPQLYLTLGAIYSDLGQADVAEAVYREGIATYPGLAPLHAKLGALYARSKRYEEAVANLKQAEEMDPSYAETYHFLGHIFYRLGRPDEAYRSFERFLQLSPPTDPRQRLDRDLMRKIRPESKSP